MILNVQRGETREYVDELGERYFSASQVLAIVTPRPKLTAANYSTGHTVHGFGADYSEAFPEIPYLPKESRGVFNCCQAIIKFFKEWNVKPLNQAFREDCLSLILNRENCETFFVLQTAGGLGRLQQFFKILVIRYGLTCYGVSVRCSIVFVDEFTLPASSD